MAAVDKTSAAAAEEVVSPVETADGFVARDENRVDRHVDEEDKSGRDDAEQNEEGQNAQEVSQ